jgi:hypothetical protein
MTYAAFGIEDLIAAYREPSVDRLAEGSLSFLFSRRFAERRPMNRYDSTSPLSSEVVRGCYLCKLYFVWYGRNAYHSTWASKYVVDAAFHKSLPHAKQYAESQRVQGSRFYIREIAALAFPITDVSLIVTQINTVKPFERYHRRNPKSSRVSDIAAFFEPWESDTILQFLVPGDIAYPFGKCA